TLLRSSGSFAAVAAGTAAAPLPSSSGIELAYRPFELVASHPRVQLFGRFAANVAGAPGSFAGDTRQLSFGVRYQPFADVNFSVSGERAVAGQPSGPWLFRALYSWDAGFELQPGKRAWQYALAFADSVAIPGGREDAAVYLETRHGVSLNVRDAFIVTPHIVGDARFADAAGFGMNRSVEAGAGVSFKYLFNQTPHSAHRSALEALVHYRGRIERFGGNSTT